MQWWQDDAKNDLEDKYLHVSKKGMYNNYAGLSSLGVPWHTQILADQLTLFQPGGTDYAHLFTNSTHGFSDLPTPLSSRKVIASYRYVI